MSDPDTPREPAPQDVPGADDTANGGASTDEDALLWPERTVTLGDDRVVTVTEMTWGQSMRLAPHWRPLADGLFAVVGAAADAAEVDTGAVVALFEDHGESALELLAECTDLDREAIEALPLVDGQNLLVTWLKVHLGFFGRRVALGRQVARGLTEGANRARRAAGRSASSS